MSDYPIKSPRKLIEVALPLEVINVSGSFRGQVLHCDISSSSALCEDLSIISNPHPFNRRIHIRHSEPDGHAHFEVGGLRLPTSQL